MNEPFDPYYTWLGIPPNERPLDYYRFLGVRRFESDMVVIESAADQRMAHVRAFQTGPRGELAARILNELAGARVVLLNPQRKAAYDQQLRPTEPSAPRPQTSLALAATRSSPSDNDAASSPVADLTAKRHRLIAVAGGSAAAVALLAAIVIYLTSNNKLAEEKLPKSAQSETVAYRPADAKANQPLPTEIVGAKSAEEKDKPVQTESHEAIKPLVTIISARWGGGENWADVTEWVRRAVSRGETVYASTGFLHADPTPHWRKHLQITFETEGQRKSIQIDEDRKWTKAEYAGHAAEPHVAVSVAPEKSPAPSSPTADAVPEGQFNAAPASADIGSPSPAVSATEAPAVPPPQTPVIPPALIHAAPLNSTNAPLASAALAVFKDNCYRCHGHDGSNEGGLNFILQSDKLIAKGYIIPGDTSGSRLYKRVAADTMPPADEQPRPTADQTASIRKWIEAGAPQLIAPPASRAWIANTDIVRAIYDDVQRHASADRQFLRYFTLTHLYNAGLSDDELQSYRLGFSKLVNSLSWGVKIVVPQPIDAAQTILRVDLRDFKWTDKTWDAIVAQNPYSFLAETSQTRDLARLTRTELPFVRADWFVAAASVPPLYYQVLQMPDTSAALESLLRISVADDIQQLRVARAGFNKSGISHNNRLIERHETYFGAYWRSYDFAHSDGRANLFSHPLGPDSGANSFRHDAGEIIFNLPNGLQAYMLVDGAGDRLDKASLAIVSDPRRPDRAVASGLSCISCHIGGIHEKADEVREAVHTNLKSFSAAEAEAVAAMYLPQAKMRELQAKDAERFQAALKLTGVLPSRTEPVLMLVQRFEQPLDLTMASAELGIEPAKLLKLLDTAPQSSRTLAALRVPGGTIQRQVLLDSLETLAAELKLNRANTFVGAKANSTDVVSANPEFTNNGDGHGGSSSNDLSPMAVLKFGAEIPDIILSKDRRWVYLLNASDGILQRIDTQSMQVDGKVVKLAAGTEHLRIAPNGRTLYTCGSPNGHGGDQEKPGEFQIIQAERFEISGTFKVRFDPWDFAADDNGRMFATGGSGNWPPVRLVDANKAGVVTDLQRSHDVRVGTRLSHDGKTLWADGSRDSVLFSVGALRLKTGEHIDYSAVLPSRGPAAFSADDKFLITGGGGVFRIGNSTNRNLPIVASIDPSQIVEVDPQSKLVFTITPQHQLKIYTAPDFELQGSFNLSGRIGAMAVDFVNGRLYAAVNKEIKQDGRNATENTVSNVEIYDISAIVGHGIRVSSPKVAAEKTDPEFKPKAPNSTAGQQVARVEGPSGDSGGGTNELKRLVTFKVAASIPDLALSPDRRFLYFLNATDGEIRRLDTESSTLDDTVVTTGAGALRLRLTPNGNTLYAIASPDGHPRGQDHGTGKIIVVSTKQFKALDRFSIPVEPLDIAPEDNGKIFLLQPGQMTNIQLVDAHKQAIVSPSTVVWYAKNLNLSRDGKNLVVGNAFGGLVFPAGSLLPTNGTNQGIASLHLEIPGHWGGGRFQLSPDGKFLTVEDGRVGRIGNSRDEHIPEVANLGPWDAVAFDPSMKRVLVATPDKQLKVFSIPDFEVQRAFNIGARIREMALDAQAGKLYATVAETVDRSPRATNPGTDLAVFDVSDLSGKINSPSSEGAGRVRTPTPAETTPQATAAPSQSAPGQWVDVLKLVDTNRNAVGGKWSRHGAEIACVSGNARRLELPMTIDGSYDLEVEFTRTEGNRLVTVIFPVGAHNCSATLGYSFGAVSGLDTVDGHNLDGKDNTYVTRPGALNNGQRYLLLIQVRTLTAGRAAVDVSLDGKTYLPHWEGQAAALGIEGAWALPHPKRAGLGANATFTFHTARLRMISGQATFDAIPTESKKPSPGR